MTAIRHILIGLDPIRILSDNGIANASPLSLRYADENDCCAEGGYLRTDGRPTDGARRCGPCWEDWDTSNDPNFIRYLYDSEERDTRWRQRRNAEPPMRWGERMAAPPDAPAGVDGYFCESCWRSGDETGFHPYDSPPCDPIDNRPSWA